MKKINIITIIVVLIVLVAGCKTVDLRSNYIVENTENKSSYTRGKELLDETYKAMGYNFLESVETYETTVNFDWKYIYLTMPLNSLPGNNNNDIQFRFATHTFDGQVKYIEGRKEDKIYGLQSWQGYYMRNETEVVEKQNSKRYAWGLATYHYLLEAPMRLRNAEIIKYAGEKSVGGQMYDLIFITWGSEAPNKEFDQWLLYVNKETKFIDLTEVTIGDFFLPMPKGMQHGSVWFHREKTAIGTYLPSKVTIQIGKPKKQHKKAYNFTAQRYRFDSFSKEVLYPLDGLVKFGDSKPENTK